MSFQINHAVIHSFTKETKTTGVQEVVKKNKVLDGNLAAVAALVKGVNGLLGKPGNILSYGQFGDDMRQGLFPSKFDAYLPNAKQQANFLALSYTAIDELVKEASVVNFATGGHILVADYLNEGRPFFLVAMIKQRGGIVLDRDYVPVEITEVDLSKVYQAARINLDRYAEVQQLPEEVETDDAIAEDRTYLAFLGQGTHNQASGYFVKALGCTKGIGSSRATSNVMDAVKEYFSRPDLKPFRVEARNAVNTYLQGKLESKENAVLSEIAFCATASLKERQEDVVDDFKAFLNSDKAKVPAAFAVHGTTLKKGTRIKAETPNWSVQFERRLLGNTNNATVFFNASAKTLTFSGLDDKTIQEISAELALRNS
jgi:nucleoid-associated protein